MADDTEDCGCPDEQAETELAGALAAMPGAEFAALAELVEELDAHEEGSGEFGARFEKLKASLAGKVSDPDAVAASIGRAKYGRKGMARLAQGVAAKKVKPLHSSSYASTADPEEFPAGTPDPRGDKVTMWGPAMLAPIGKPTGDKRRFAAHSLTNRDLPRGLKWQRADGQGHAGSVIVGTLDGIEYRGDGEPWGFGLLFDPDPAQLPRLAEDVKEAKLLLQAGTIGPSVDLDDMEYAELSPEDVAQYAADARPQIEVTKGRISAATLVPIPAFAEVAPLPLTEMAPAEYAAHLEQHNAALTAAVQSGGWAGMPIAPPGTEWDAAAAARRVKAWAGDDMGKYGKAFLWVDEGNRDNVTAHKFPIADVMDGHLEIVPKGVSAALGALNGAHGGTTIPDADQARMRSILAGIQKRYDPDRDGDDDRSKATDTDHDTYAVDPGEDMMESQTSPPNTRKRKKRQPPGAAAQRDDDEHDYRYALVASAGMGYTMWLDLLMAAVQDANEQGALVASAGTVTDPPRAFFEYPENVDGLTPLTITDDRRVFGHVVDRNTCHMGFPGQCKKMPPSKTNYAYFHLGEIKTAEGDRLPVGKITLGPGHADTRWGLQPTLEHYDSVATTAAVGRVYEDKYGVWFSGILHPNADDVTVFDLRTSPPSGDWRPIGGNLELVGVHSVNVPGYAIKRTVSRVDGSGRQLALIAAAVPPQNHWALSGAMEGLDELVSQAARAAVAEFAASQAGAARRERAGAVLARMDDGIAAAEEGGRRGRALAAVAKLRSRR